MLLLTGPPGSGKSYQILKAVRERLASGRFAFRVVAPTATMAEHLRDLFAREGFVFRPSRISTLSGFVENWISGFDAVSAAALDALIEDALASLNPREFRSVAALPGFRSALGRTIEELSAAGCGADQLERAAGLQAVYRDVETSAGARRMALDGARLKAAARCIREQGVAGIESIFFDGFFSFADPELEVIEALRAHSDLTITLPSWQGGEATRERLAAMGFQEQHSEAARRNPRVVLVKARTQDRELDEIAARILDEARAGRPFREIGIVVRSSDPYVPALRAALERFGIPARFYFASPLARHSLARRVAAAEELDAWRGQTATPPEWVARFSALACLLPSASSVDPAECEMAALWRSGASAVRSFEQALRETASQFAPTQKVPFAAFWKELNRVLRLTTLRVADHRRNVVHVMDVLEARQWELPVVFVCGLIEKQFPLYHSQDPILTDEARARLREYGFRVATSGERNQAEKFLFDLATTRATDTLVLSYPEFNAKGDETLRSFSLERFLESSAEVQQEQARRVRPVPRGTRPPERRSVILDNELRLWLAQRHATIAPTALEAFVQCPFQFFTAHTLKLEELPAEPEQRFDARVQGKLLHEVLARWIRDREAVGPLFDQVFRETCAREQIPEGYRTEAVRLEMRRNLQRFTGKALISGASVSATEHKLSLPLGDGTTLHCRVDRIDSSSDGTALIIDYKYSSPQRVAALVNGHEEGTRLQGGIYMLAAKHAGSVLGGMLFAGVRKEPSWDGWHTLPVTIGRAQKCVPQVLHDVMERSRQTALDAMTRIREGVIAPSRADAKGCLYCACSDICRVESAVEAAAGAEGEQEE